jgi:hypothetical protein
MGVVMGLIDETKEPFSKYLRQEELLNDLCAIIDELEELGLKINIDIINHINEHLSHVGGKIDIYKSTTECHICGMTTLNNNCGC